MHQKPIKNQLFLKGSGQGPKTFFSQSLRVASRNEQRLGMLSRFCRGAATGALDFRLYVGRFREDSKGHSMEMSLGECADSRVCLT